MINQKASTAKPIFHLRKCSATSQRQLKASLILGAFLTGVLFIFMVIYAPSSEAHPYFNSSEPGCDGSTPTVLLCDDFEDGVWYRTNADTSCGGCGFTQEINDGWGGDVFRTINPADAILCGAGVTPFGNCAGNAGPSSNGGGQQAVHYLKTPTCGTNGGEQCDAGTDIYVRVYIKWPTGHGFGRDQEKSLNITNNDSDIRWANLQLNCGGGGTGTTSTASVAIQVIHANPGFCEYAPGFSVQTNRWYFVEMHIRKNSAAGTANGWVRLWMNDCGTDGRSCGTSPTLRVNRQNVNYTPPERTIETVWLEYWSNQSNGPGPLWDQLKVSTSGPIGFAGMNSPSGTNPPPAPTNLRIEQ